MDIKELHYGPATPLEQREARLSSLVLGSWVETSLASVREPIPAQPTTSATWERCSVSPEHMVLFERGVISAEKLWAISAVNNDNDKPR